MAATLDTTPRNVYFAGQPMVFELSTTGSPSFDNDYRHFVDIRLQGGSGTLAVIPLIVDDSDESKVDISAIIRNSLLSNNAPLIPVASNETHSQANVKDSTTRLKFFLQIGEILDGEEQAHDEVSATFTVLLGGLAAKYENFDWFDFTGYTQHFFWLTTLGNFGRDDFTIYTSDYAPHFLAYTNQLSATNTALKATFFYNDAGQTSIFTNTVTISDTYQKYIFQAGARQMNNGTTGCSDSQKLVKFEVEAVKNTSDISSSKITFEIVHYWNIRTQYLVVGNSQGGFDTVTCDVVVNRQLLTKGDTATRLGDLDTDIGRSFAYNSEAQHAYTMQTRLLREFELNQIMQLLHNPWWAARYDFDDQTNCPPKGTGTNNIDFGASWTPITIQKGSIQIIPSQDRLFRVQFVYVEAYTNEYV